MDVFEALADPVRRDILDLLRSGECEAGAIAARFPISRPAISRHLRVLREAGLVSARLDGRRRLYRVHPERLGDVDAWLAPFREMPLPRKAVTDGGTWSSRLDALETEVFRTRRDRRQTSDSRIEDMDRRDKEQSA
ncbi:MAG: metalloregulator ArsR/SmtB family transcription factor [Thermomicrobiales bacterium]